MIKHTVSKRRAAFQMMRNHIANRKSDISYALNFAVQRMNEVSALPVDLPKQIVLLRVAENDSSQDQLFLDRVPVPRKAWKLHPRDHTLTWRGPYGGGYLVLAHDLLSGTGVIGSALKSASVQVNHVTSFACDVACGAGTSPVVDGHTIRDLRWTPGSDAWNNAAWIPQAMQINHYMIPASAPWESPTLSMSFIDLETTNQWQPDQDSQTATLTSVVDPDGGMSWKLGFNCEAADEAYDNRKGLTGPNDQTIDTVFPYMLRASEDAAIDSITGAMLIDSDTISGATCGIRGQRVQSNATGYYQLPGTTANDKALIFGLFNGQIFIDDTLVENMRLIGNRLVWKNLPASLQTETGLTAYGSMVFDHNGSTATLEGNKRQIQRVSLTALPQALNAQKEKYKKLTALHNAASDAADDPGLQVTDLLTLTSQTMQTPTDSNGNPLKDKDGNPLPAAWVDVIQQRVTQDLSTIMNASIPADTWSKLFGSTPQTTLTPELQSVAQSQVPGSDPGTWYTSLATAVLSQGLSTSTDGNAVRLNAPRAQRWLKEQTAASPVYHTHGQELFQYHWSNLYPDDFPPFLTDQQTNLKYVVEIPSYILEQTPAIASSILVSASFPADTISQLTKQFENLGAYALTNKLYWAFALYFHITSSGVLNTVTAELNGSIASEDSSRLTRLYQQYMTLLTALDPSGFFAKQYLQTFQIFLATYTVPSMVDLSGAGYSEDMITQFLNQFISDNKNSSDSNVKEFAFQLQAFITSNPQAVSNSLRQIRQLSQTISTIQSFPRVATNFVTWFTETYPSVTTMVNGYVTVFLGGLTVLSALGLLDSLKDWDNLDSGTQAEVCINASQLVLQMVSGVLSRSVSWYTVFATDGLSNMQRASATFRILIGTNPDELGIGLNRLSGSMARWIAGAAPEGEAAVAAGGAAAAQEASLASRILGSSMSEFIAVRVGTIFALAGMGFSLYHLIEGDTGIEAAADYVGYFGSAFAIFAVVGGWALTDVVSAGAIATITGVAGALSIACALAGIGILIYELMTAKPDDPVEDFVDGVATQAGFTTTGKCSSIDYAVAYNDPDQNNLGIMGFQLITNGTALIAQPNGAVIFGAPDNNFATVWNADTNGTGISIISTMIDRGDGNGLVAVLLSAMVDGSISFQDEVPASQMPGEKITTQRWLITNTENATLAGGQYLKTLPITLQPVLADANHNFYPQAAILYLNLQNGKLSPFCDTGLTFTLTMAGRAPATMIMRDMSFVLNSQTDTVFKPIMEQIGSAQMSFALGNGQTLPPFLDFDPATGTISQNNLTPTTLISATPFTITASNPLGSTSTTFNIEVVSGIQPSKKTSQPKFEEVLA